MVWIGGRWTVNNISAGYHGIMVKWWHKYGLSGRVLVVGEKGIYADNVKKKLLKEFPEITELYSVDLVDADIIWDITKPFPMWSEGFDFIICQAVLEHLSAPALAMINMLDVLKVGGYLFIQTCNPDFGYHAEPVDCCRFFKDVLKEWGKLTSAELVESVYESPQVIATYKKGQWGRYIITYIEDNLTLREYTLPL